MSARTTSDLLRTWVISFPEPTSVADALRHPAIEALGVSRTQVEKALYNRTRRERGGFKTEIRHARVAGRRRTLWTVRLGEPAALAPEQATEAVEGPKLEGFRPSRDDLLGVGWASFVRDFERVTA
jgi:hypothetical protein